MIRRWDRSWLAVAALVGAVGGLGAFTFGYAEGLAYLSDDPRACANCHVMNEPFEGWQKGPHHAVATCNDCHVPHTFVGRWLSKGLNGFHHSKAFTLQGFHEPIRITPRNAAALQASCLHCHGDFVHEITAARRDAAGADEVRCVHCHRNAGHGPSEGEGGMAASRSVSPWLAAGVAIAAAAAAAGIAALLVDIDRRKAEARDPYLKLVRVGEETTDPAPWGTNWPRQYDSYRRTADATRTRYGGSEGAPARSRLEKDPWLVRMFAGYAFALDFRERRGHAYMLYDQEQTRRITERLQPGACLHCHASVIPTYRRLGAGNVHEGFVALGKLPYAEAHAEVVATGSMDPVARGATQEFEHVPGAHPVSCVDCHDPRTMALRVTRPGFLAGIAALAAGSAPVPHLPSVGRWRAGDRARPYDPNVDASRQELRSFACGQCHVEYYCGPKLTLFFPWAEGLRVEQVEAVYDATRFDDGHRFYDWQHAETGAELLKAQHPEFETWSQGVHARAGVACADCHMPYQREGALKVSDHWVRSPLLNVARACQPCHPVAESELLARVATIQDRTDALMERAAVAQIDMLDAIVAARAAGAGDTRLGEVLELQRRAQWRLDFVNAENSMGFHAPQETARVLGEAIDYARQAQLRAAALGR